MSHHHPQHHTKSHEPQPPTADSQHRTGAADADGSQPTADRIRLRAYEISQARKGEQGDALTDWTQAEQELKAGYDAKR